MNFTERLTGALESLLLAVVMGWTITISVALISPEQQRERTGVVEVHSLTPVVTHPGV